MPPVRAWSVLPTPTPEPGCVSPATNARGSVSPREYARQNLLAQPRLRAFGGPLVRSKDPLVPARAVLNRPPPGSAGLLVATPAQYGSNGAASQMPLPTD